MVLRMYASWSSELWSFWPEYMYTSCPSRKLRSTGTRSFLCFSAFSALRAETTAMFRSCMSLGRWRARAVSDLVNSKLWVCTGCFKRTFSVSRTSATASASCCPSDPTCESASGAAIVFSCPDAEWVPSFFELLPSSDAMGRAVPALERSSRTSAPPSSSTSVTKSPYCVSTSIKASAVGNAWSAFSCLSLGVLRMIMSCSSVKNTKPAALSGRYNSGFSMRGSRFVRNLICFNCKSNCAYNRLLKPTSGCHSILALSVFSDVRGNASRSEVIPWPSRSPSTTIILLRRSMKMNPVRMSNDSSWRSSSVSCRVAIALDGPESSIFMTFALCVTMQASTRFTGVVRR
mmetsp:Transcript_10797/g.25837  ORF Transcript_10797/g.25837 Transcript_10797/m.25837 type:complete len:346 (-) Transcript_10797:383-1420(-)